MSDQEKSKGQLIAEPGDARSRILELEAAARRPSKAGGAEAAPGAVQPSPGGASSADDSTSEARERGHAEQYINSLPGLFYVFDDERFVRWNSEWTRVTGYSDEELAARYGTDFFEGADRALIGERMASVFVEGSAVAEAELVTKDGRRLPYFFTGMRREIDGKPHLVGLGIDISERRQVEDALRQSEAQKGAILDGISSNIAFVNRDLEVQWVNKAAADSVGKTQGEMIGETCHRQWANSDLSCEGCPTVRAFETKQRERATIVTPDGRVWDEIGEPVFDEQGEVLGVVEIATDVTEQRRSDDAKAALEEQLHESRKMEAIGRLAGGVAHDFNNMLCAIAGNVAMVMDELAPQDPLYASLVEIDEAADRAANLTGQLLAFSRKQVREPRVINLAHVIDKLHAMLVRLIGEDVHLRSVSQERLGMIRADLGQIEQVVLNLVLNARDAMPDGGELLIETADVAVDDAWVATRANMAPGAYVMLRVSDTGCGMSAEVQEKIFEPFFTTKELGRGTGLGLATVFGIVEQNGGRIEIASEPGRGSSFEVYFQAVVGETEARPRTDALTTAGGTEVVLVVEDEQALLRLAERFLTRRGYEVLVAASGHDALRVARQHEGPIDLLFTDVVMPHMNGRELATKLIEQRPKLEVLYTSGYTQDVIAHRGVLDAGLNFLDKPYSLKTLAARVRDLLDGRS